MSSSVDSLWEIVHAAPRIDANSLARAIESASSVEVDFRTRLLIRDSVRALETHWGQQRLETWLSRTPQGESIRHICESIRADADGEHGFPSLKRRVVDATHPETVVQFFRDLSRYVAKPTRLFVGGSVAVIISGQLQRKTEDIDIVDEVPEEIRTQYQVLSELEERYGLQLTHFQSHYLATGWQQRVHSIGTFRALQVFAIDAYDVFLSKLFSLRSKDRDDLRALLPKLDREELRARFQQTTSSLQAEARLRDAAVENWYVLFGEELPG